ncbi:MAG: type III pantothenate kinase [Burkholderia sp.]
MSDLALLVDAGNSRIKWALADAGGRLVESATFDHGADDATAAIPAWPDWSAPRGAWISNVAGTDVAARIEALIEARWPGLPHRIVTARAAQCGISNGYTQPSQLGSDRWFGLIGARAAFPDEALLIATFGTATTLELLEADGRFVGGLIAPGWALMMRSLGTHTAQLPTLSTDTAQLLVDELSQAAGRIAFATDTAHSLSVGCLQAQAGLVERAWRERSVESTRPVRLVLSGGGATDAVAKVLTVPYTRHDTLVLSGLARIAHDAMQA